jgi:hypothetical protein
VEIALKAVCSVVALKAGRKCEIAIDTVLAHIIRELERVP